MEPSDKDHDIEELQNTVDELQEVLRFKDQRIAELEGYTQSLERQQEDSDAHIKSLNETISRQDELISEQQDFSKENKRTDADEIGQLTEILEAQEKNLNEQRSIIEEQAKLIADLSSHMQDGDDDSSQSEGGAPAMHRELSREAGVGQQNPAGPGGARANGSSAPRQQPGPSRGPSTETTPRGPRTGRSDPNSMPSSRLSPREMLLKRPVGQGNSGGPQPAPGGPPRPRPNSALGNDAPRAKSWGAGGRDSNGREPEIVRRPGPKQPTTCTAGGRPSGRRYPPALPALEQRV